MRNVINLELAVKQKVTPALHNELNHLQLIMECVVGTANLPCNKSMDYSELVEFLEFKMQEQWNFTLDSRWHTHWMRLNNRRGTTNE